MVACCLYWWHRSNLHNHSATWVRQQLDPHGIQSLSMPVTSWQLVSVLSHAIQYFSQELTHFALWTESVIMRTTPHPDAKSPKPGHVRYTSSHRRVDLFYVFHEEWKKQSTTVDQHVVMFIFMLEACTQAQSPLTLKPCMQLGPSYLRNASKLTLIVLLLKKSLVPTTGCGCNNE
jgi:hypothetical protein